MPAPVIWLFEDQLRTNLRVMRDFPDSPVLLIESRRALSMWPYHKKRLTFLISAMRHFAQELREAGREVLYFGLDRKPYVDSIAALRHVIRLHGRHFITVAPSEYHTQAWLEQLPQALGIRIDVSESDLFLTDRAEFAKWARSLKSPVMETFYRKMRVKQDVLMDNGEPVGGVWNLDHDNRKGPPKKLDVPGVPAFEPDTITRGVMKDVERCFAHHYGSTSGFDLPCSRANAREYFEDFLEHRLPLFGDYEDAMMTGQRTMFHSKISPLINTGLLEPMPVIRAAEKRYRQRKAPLNAVEGFVRQVLGWREYVYGIYWSFMPEYRNRNARGSTRDLPGFFWDAKTDLNCLRQTLEAVVEDGYSHHIQRLMILCNFATLVGLNPQQVNDWFLTMYIDSHDWVVTPNVVGMGMNADGTVMATKPYISGAAYINRMSNYCTDCRYDPKLRTGENACPFNYLFWTFLHHYKDQFKKNPRMSMMLKNAEKIDNNEMKQMLELRKQFIQVKLNRSKQTT